MATTHIRINEQDKKWLDKNMPGNYASNVGRLIEFYRGKNDL